MTPGRGGGIPSLGPQGEGWVYLQVVCIGLVVLGALLAPGIAVGGSPGTFGVVGDVIIVAALALIVWGLVTLRAARALTAVPYPVADGELVETGPYRFVRHPIYSGLILAAAGASISRESLAAGIATIALAVVLDLKRRREEGWLLERYSGYAAYRTRTRALVPFLY
jgi:protein-S-isoprenylcysteine O-methyltransferase Ste14